MNVHVSRHLSSLSHEIVRTGAHLHRLRDRLELQEAALTEQRLRMLIAETPLADRDLHEAADGFCRLAREVRLVEATLEGLVAEQDRLFQRLTWVGA